MSSGLRIDVGTQYERDLGDLHVLNWEASGGEDPTIFQRKK